MSDPCQLGWFSTGRGKGSQGLLKVVQNSIKSGDIEAEIAFIFCSRERGETEVTDTFLDMIENCNIPLVSFSYQHFKKGQSDGSDPNALPAWRLDYDREVMARLQDFRPDLCILAGYMLIVGPELCRKYDMINLHPAAPGGPTGTWKEVIWQLIEHEAETTGVIMHLVIPELDKGPPATYCTFPIRGEPFDRYWDEIRGYPIDKIRKDQGENNNLFQTIRQHGFARELPLIISTIKAFSQGRVKITDDEQVVNAANKPINGYDLTEEINEQVKETLS